APLGPYSTHDCHSRLRMCACTRRVARPARLACSGQGGPRPAHVRVRLLWRLLSAECARTGSLDRALHAPRAQRVRAGNDAPERPESTDSAPKTGLFWPISVNGMPYLWRANRTSLESHGKNHCNGRNAREEAPRPHAVVCRSASSSRSALPIRWGGEGYGRLSRLQLERHLRNHRRERSGVGRKELLEEGGESAREVEMEPQGRRRFGEAHPERSVVRAASSSSHARSSFPRLDRDIHHARFRLVVRRPSRAREGGLRGWETPQIPLPDVS